MNFPWGKKTTAKSADAKADLVTSRAAFEALERAGATASPRGRHLLQRIAVLSRRVDAIERRSTAEERDKTLSAARSTLQASVEADAVAMGGPASALAAAQANLERVQERLRVDAAEDASTAAKHRARIDLLRQEGHDLVLAGDESSGTAKLLEAAKLEQGDGRAVAARGKQLLLESLRGVVSKAAEEVQARQAEFEAAQEAYAKGAFELRCIEFDQANLAAADAFFELQAAVPPSLRNIWRLPFVDSLCLLVGASKAHREMVGAETVEPFDGRKLQYQLALRGPGESLTPAAEALLSVDWKQLPMNMPVVEESETVRENIRLRKEQETIASAPVDHQDRIEWMRKRAGTAPAAAARTMA